jgi:hypothetical protein
MNGMLASALIGFSVLLVGLIIIRLTPEDRCRPTLDDLRTRNADLERRIADLEARLAASGSNARTTA